MFMAVASARVLIMKAVKPRCAESFRAPIFCQTFLFCNFFNIDRYEVSSNTRLKLGQISSIGGDSYLPLGLVIFGNRGGFRVAQMGGWKGPKEDGAQQFEVPKGRAGRNDTFSYY